VSQRIRSDGRSPVEFEAERGVSSFALGLDDGVADAEWRLEIFVKREEGGWMLLGAIDTIAPKDNRIATYRNRIVAICSVPGATNWQIRPTLLAGTVLSGKSGVSATLSFSAIDFPAQGCCPITPITGASVPSASGIEDFETGAMRDLSTVAPEPLGNESKYRRGIMVQAPRANGETLIYIVDSLTGDGGLELEAGERVQLPLSNMAKVFVIADAEGAAVFWTGFL
jgi:hypothetical protein